MMQDPNQQAQETTETAAAPAAAEATPKPAVGDGAQAEAVAALTAEVASLEDRLKRALAEVENVRRQKEREVDEARRYAITGFARGLLEVADNLRRALAAVPGEAAGRDPLLQTLVTGVEMTERTLLALFEKHRIRKVQPELGERFDPTLHQAMLEVPTAQHPPGSVAEVLQPGYVLVDRLLRPALVGVAKAPAAQAEPNAAPGTEVDTKV